jgi:hypothetical protein
VGGFSDPTYGQRTIGVFDAATVSGVKRLSWGVGSSGNIIQTYLTGATTINVNNTSSFQFWLGGIVLEESGTTGSITKVGNGQLILAPFTGDSSSQSSFSGGLTLNEGMVVLGGLSGGGDYKPLGTGTFTINGGTVSVDWEQPAINVTNATNVGADFTFQNSAGTATTFSGNFDFQGGARKITVSSTSGLTGTLTLTGGISNGGIVKAGTGTLRLVAGSSKTLTSLLVSAGTMELSGAGVLTDSTPTSVAASGTLSITTDSSTGTVTLGALNGTGLVQIPSSLMKLSLNPAADAVFSGTITGSGGLIKIGSFKEQLVLGGPKSLSSILVSGGTLELAGAGVLTDSTPTSVAASGTLAITTDSAAGTVTLGALNGTGTVSIASAMTLSLNPAADSVFSGTITGSGALIKMGTFKEQILLGGPKALSSILVSGGTLELAGAAVLTDSTPTSVAASGTLAITTDSAAGTVTLGALTGTGTVSIASAMTLSLNPAADSVFSGTITGSGGLIKAGSFKEQLLLGGPKALSSILITGGTLELVGAAVLTDSTPVSVSASGSLLLTSNSAAGTVTIGALNGNGSVQVASGMTLSMNPATSGTFSDGITGGGALLKTGAGTQTFSGTVGNVGGMSVNGGLLIVSGTFSSSYTGATTVSSSGNATLDLKTNYPSSAGSISFSGNTSNTVALAGSTIIADVAQTWTTRNIFVLAGSTLAFNVPNTIGTSSGTANVVALTVASLTVGATGATGRAYLTMSQSGVDPTTGARVYKPMVIVTGGLLIPTASSVYTGFGECKKTSVKNRHRPL